MAIVRICRDGYSEKTSEPLRWFVEGTVAEMRRTFAKGPIPLLAAEKVCSRLSL
jgi:hypothetical protein